MAFGARSVDGVWRLCLRKGRTITNASGEDIRFSSQAKAKACADALNEKHWKAFELADRKRQPLLDWEAMLDLIKEHAL